MKLNRKAALLAGGFAATLSVGFFAGQAFANQPNMEAALVSLHAARADLVAATDNKGGHRLKAMGYVDLAITEVKAGIAYAQ